MRPCLRMCPAIEIIDGYVIYREAPAPARQTAGPAPRKPDRDPRPRRDGPRLQCLTVNTDVDLRLQDVPLLNRRPDLVLYRCIPADRQLRAEDALLVAEIVSLTIDAVDKFGEYARAGIAHYWLVRLDATGVSVIERYRLDHAKGSYKHVGTAMKDELDNHPTPRAS